MKEYELTLWYHLLKMQEELEDKDPLQGSAYSSDAIFNKVWKRTECHLTALQKERILEYYRERERAKKAEK